MMNKTVRWYNKLPDLSDFLERNPSNPLEQYPSGGMELYRYHTIERYPSMGQGEEMLISPG